MHIRPARPADDPFIGELLITAFLTAYAKKLPDVVYDDQRKNDLRDVATKRREGTVLVAVEDDAVIGTVMIYPPGAPKSEAWVANAADLRQLAMAPAHFGQGHSRALLDEAERIAWSWGVSAITLHVRRGATGVAKLYEKRGYVRTPSGDRDTPTVYLEAYLLAHQKSGFIATKPPC